jgi:hypothetical protein
MDRLTQCAEALYTSCDGVEFERSSNFMDIRYVPNGTQITTTPKESASDIPGLISSAFTLFFYHLFVLVSLQS